ncbi:MAG: GNAT family N-acetyltransferase [Nocardioidaceae bacterium]
MTAPPSRQVAVNADAESVLSAREAASESARRSDVRITVVGRTDDIAVIDHACTVLNEVWKPDPDDPPLTPSIVRALSHAGNYCAVAFDHDTPVGACLGFAGLVPAGALHSHIAGVTAAVSGRHVGFALKLDQRAWALERGLTSILWTFDPLVRRNAYFNAAKLGARPTEYLNDFYGDMHDAINAGQGSDRLVAEWDLLAPDVVAACEGHRRHADVTSLVDAGAAVVLDEVEGGPSPATALPSSGVALVRVPADVESLRTADPGLAREWRLAVRSTLGALLERGWKVDVVSRDGYYVLEPAPTA